MTKQSLVLQTDFGLGDGAVSAMYGVANCVDPTIRIFDLTHDIPTYNIWEASYRLFQTVTYWPKGTVFVSVVDPGVGSNRLSIVAKTTSGHYIVTPDNGTLTHLATHIGIEEARIIDENKNRLPQSGESYTFHGRDVYAYTGARLATDVIAYEEVGNKIDLARIVLLENPNAYYDEHTFHGNIDILDVRFGNLWSNIPRALFVSKGVAYGDVIEVSIRDGHREVYHSTMVYGRSFMDTQLGEPLLYVNSLDQLGIAINQGSFAKAYHVGTGANWQLTLRATGEKKVLLDCRRS